MEATGGIKNTSFKVLAHTSNSQIKQHIPYGGVVPMLAKREHLKNLPILLEKTLKEAKRNLSLNLIAVTYGPGLEPALWTGITFAQELAKKWKVPIIPVNHMEGHILSVFGKVEGKFSIKLSDYEFPMLALLVSGGHTQLVLIKKWLDYEILGETLDDAVGEAFDKVARMLGLPYPGGPEISRLAEIARKIPLLRGGSKRRGGKKSTSPATAGTPQEENFHLPRPMFYIKDFNFSFSGLKTAVLYLIRKIGKLDKTTKSQIALEFEKAAVECLIYKTKKAIEEYKIKTVIVGGGVAANKYLRSEMKKITGRNIKLLFPTQELSGDNSLMIGIAGYLQYMKNKGKIPSPSSIKADGGLKL